MLIGLVCTNKQSHKTLRMERIKRELKDGGEGGSDAVRVVMCRFR